MPLCGVISVGIFSMFPPQKLMIFFVATKIMIGSSVAIPACSLCINRRLYHIASVSSVTKTKAQKRRDIMTDLAIGVGIPVLEMILRTFIGRKTLDCD
jgi:hypothetical protein